MSLLVLFSRGFPHTSTVGHPGIQLTVAGTQGAGVVGDLSGVDLTGGKTHVLVDVHTVHSFLHLVRQSNPGLCFRYCIFAIESKFFKRAVC